jgi:hypothetical protein
MTIQGDFAFPPADFPAWLPNGAESIMSWALYHARETLVKMIAMQPGVTAALAALPPGDERSEAELLRAGEIIQPLDALDFDLGCACYTAILMAVIECESWTNMVAFYRLGETVAQTMESLNPLAKLEVVHRVLGRAQFKGTHQQEALGKLFKWRNAFGHGKNPDRPTKSLRENHLVFPLGATSPREEIANLLAYLDAFIVVQKHLGEISPFTMQDSGLSIGFKFTVEAIDAVRSFHFDDQGRPMSE